MYKVKVAPEAANMLTNYAVQFAANSGEQTANRLILSYEKSVESLKEFPARGSKKLPYMPTEYRIIPFWKYLWFVYLIDDVAKAVFVDYILGDRSDFRVLFGNDK